MLFARAEEVKRSFDYLFLPPIRHAYAWTD
jgi:hypothetical protein